MAGLIYSVTGKTFSFGPVVIELNADGIRFAVSEPCEVTLPWADGGMEFSEWVGRMIE